MKNYMIAAAVVAAGFATPAMADDITAEIRFADVRSGAHDSTEYRVEYNAPLNSFLNYGAEIQVKQQENAGSIGSKVSARVGPRLPEVLGFTTNAYGEVGQNLSAGDNFMFWGAGVKTRHQVYGPISMNVGYRHRETFNNTGRLTENRLSGGLGLDIGEGNAVGVNYYRTTGTTRSDAIGVAFNHRF